jgi:hypothetical protein
MKSLPAEFFAGVTLINILSRVKSLVMKCGLVIGFIELLQIVTKNNYNTVANSNTLQFITPHIKPSRSAVFASRCLIMVSNAVDFSASGFTSLLAGDCLTAP